MKRVINLRKNDDDVQIIINSDKTIQIDLEKNELNIKSLYTNLAPASGDEFTFDDEVRKEVNPKTDIARLYNNLYDFLEELFKELNTVLQKALNDEKGM